MHGFITLSDASHMIKHYNEAEIQITDKGLGLIRGFFGLRFPENVKLLNLCCLYSHNKALCHSYQDCAQTNVCMFTVAMQTPINKVKKNILHNLQHLLAVFKASN